MKKVRFLGLDVHAETIAVAVAEPEGAQLNDQHSSSFAHLAIRAGTNFLVPESSSARANSGCGFVLQFCNTDGGRYARRSFGNLMG